MTPVFDEYRRLTSAGAKEFKHTEFKRIGYRDRRNLTFRIRDAFKANGVFVTSFYTPLRSFVLERVRTDLFLDDQVAIPENYDELYAKAATDLQEEARGPGQSGLIAKLLTLPVSGLANLLASLGSEFTLIYDPREKREDKAVKATINAFLSLFQNFKGKDIGIRWDLGRHVRAFITDRRSEDELGLQMADLIAGETREFYQANAELLDYRASRVLVTPTSEEPLISVSQMEGRWFKTGAMNRMSGAIRKRFFRQDPQGRTVLPLLRELFGAGIMTCYSNWGQPRDLMFFDGYVWDQLE
jgi:hypothetical protein